MSILAYKVVTRVVRRYKSESEVNVVCIVTPRQGLASVAALFAREGVMNGGMRLLGSGPSGLIDEDRLLEEERVLGMIKKSAYTA